jgi:hypothetical protein
VELAQNCAVWPKLGALHPSGVATKTANHENLGLICLLDCYGMVDDSIENIPESVEGHGIWLPFASIIDGPGPENVFTRLRAPLDDPSHPCGGQIFWNQVSPSPLASVEAHLCRIPPLADHERPCRICSPAASLAGNGNSKALFTFCRVRRMPSAG